jgi:hypothetical protein
VALKHVFALAVLLIPASALAECETEAIKARAMIVASGPFQFEVKFTSQGATPSPQEREWLGDQRGDQTMPPGQKISGLIEPMRGDHILNAHQSRYGVHALEEVNFGDQTWIKGDAGWYQPLTHANPDVKIFLPPATYIVSAKCLGPVEIEAKSLIGYELQYPRLIVREQVFVEQGTGLTVRLEKIYNGGTDIINFRYDASIRIEPPKVEADAPKIPEQPFRFGAATRF